MNKNKIIGVIPARFQSTRLPGKPLQMIGSQTMIERVYRRCLQSKLLDAILIATDDQRILDEVTRFGGVAVLTSAAIPTGTDRCFTAVEAIYPDAEIVVNIQGDEPLIDPAVIDTCIGALLDNSATAVCATPVCEIASEEDLHSTNCVKCVFDLNGNALYFSRSPIPFMRNKVEGFKHYKHIGLYAYQKRFLNNFVKMNHAVIEEVESLEQLRILANGYKIQCCVVKYDAIGVDTPEDLDRVRAILND